MFIRFCKHSLSDFAETKKEKRKSVVPNLLVFDQKTANRPGRWRCDIKWQAFFVLKFKALALRFEHKLSDVESFQWKPFQRLRQ